MGIQLFPSRIFDMVDSRQGSYPLVAFKKFCVPLTPLILGLPGSLGSFYVSAA